VFAARVSQAQRATLNASKSQKIEPETHDTSSREPEHDTHEEGVALSGSPEKKTKIKPKERVFVQFSTAEKGPNGKEIDMYGWTVPSAGMCTHAVKLLYVVGCVSHVYSPAHFCCLCHR
jgi:hypothetical protein